MSKKLKVTIVIYQNMANDPFLVPLLRTLIIQNLSPEVFYEKRCSQKFQKIHRKTPVPESLFKQICRPKYSCRLEVKIHRKTPVPESLFSKKETLAQVFSCEFCKIPKNTFFTEHLWKTASRKDQFRGVFRAHSNNYDGAFLRKH